MVADLLSLNCCHWLIAKVENFNLNVTEVQDWEFKNAFPGILNFTVGILDDNSFQIILEAFAKNPLFELKISSVLLVKSKVE